MTTHRKRKAPRRHQPIILAIIPARGRSRRLPGKHLRRLCGRPLIAHVIVAARRVRALTAVMVSTDSPAIARAARRYGALVPFLRPSRLARDTTPIYPVIEHAVREYERLTGTVVDIVVLLQATTPTTTPNDIRACLRRITEDHDDAAMTVFRVYDRPEWCGVIRNGRFTTYASPDRYRAMARQDFYMATGGVYAIRRRALFRERTFYARRCGTVLVPPERNTDIDTLKDFLVAETLLRRMRKERKR